MLDRTRLWALQPFSLLCCERRLSAVLSLPKGSFVALVEKRIETKRLLRAQEGFCTAAWLRYTLPLRFRALSRRYPVNAYWAFTLILALALSACGSTGAQDTSTATLVLSPAEGPVLSPAEGLVLSPAEGLVLSPAEGPTGLLILFKDDFNDSNSGWLEAADAESSQGYRNGQFFFEVRSPDLIVWDNAEGNFRDFVLEVEARQVSGAVESSYGVLWRYIDDGNFYRFDLTGDGYYAVSKLEYGEWVILVDWQASVHIKPQGEVNRIGVICQGPRMTFRVNGEELAGVEDSSFERGDVGLFASTFTDPNVEVEFDNLEIREALGKP